MIKICFKKKVNFKSVQEYKSQLFTILTRLIGLQDSTSWSKGKPLSFYRVKITITRCMSLMLRLYILIFEKNVIIAIYVL